MSGPRMLGRYRLGEKLGGGSMGAVYAAEDTRLGRRVAVKIMPPGMVDSPEMVERFHREVEVASSLSHPHLVAVYDAGEDDETGGPFLVMELVEGTTLRDLLRAEGPLEPARAARIVRQAALGLHCAHEHGVVHRDVKPGNLLLTEDGTVKVADFGIARPAVSQMTRTGQLMGTPQYMSPEQITGESVDARSDVFSLGVILYQALTGERPFEGETVTAISYRLVHSRPPPPSAVRPSIPAAYDGILARCLAKAPVDRYPDADALARDLEPLARGEAGPPTVGAGAEPTEPPGLVASPLRLLVPIASGVALALFLALAAFLLLREGGGTPTGPAPPQESADGAAEPSTPAGSSSRSESAPTDPGSSGRPEATSGEPGAASVPGEDAATVHFSFRHGQDEGVLEVSLDGRALLRQSLAAEGAFSKEEVRGSFRVPAGRRRVEAVLILPDVEAGESLRLGTSEERNFSAGEDRYLLLKYHRFLGSRELKMYWDTPRARRAAGG